MEAWRAEPGLIVPSHDESAQFSRIRLDSIVNERGNRAICQCLEMQNAQPIGRALFVSIDHSTSVLQKVNIFVGKLVPPQPASNFWPNGCLDGLKEVRAVRFNGLFFWTGSDFNR
jgi:hypothetical protein